MAQTLTVSDRQKVIALALGFLALATGLAVQERDLAPWDDNAQFIVVGKSIASGQGLREINDPDRAVHRKYPAGFPLLLAAVERIWPDNLRAMQYVVLAHFVAATVLLYWLMLLWSSGRVALLVASLFCTSQLALQFATDVMSEVPFTCFVLLALLLFERQEKAVSRPAGTWLFVGALLASLWALMLRTVGISLIAALCVRCLLLRRWWRAAALALAAVAIFWLHSRLRGSGPDEYLASFMLQDPYDAAKGGLTLLGFGERVLSNLSRYGRDLIPGAILPWPSSAWLRWPLGLLCLVGLLRFVRKGHPSALYLGAGLAVQLAWPRIWAVPRFLLPLQPVLLFFVISTLAWIGALLREHWAGRLSQGGLPAFPTRLVRRAGVVLAGAAAVAVALINLRLAVAQVPQRDVRWQQYLRALEWLRDNSPADSVVMCRKPFFGHLYSRRKTVPISRTSDERAFLKELERLDYIVIDSLPLPGTWENVVPNLRRHRARFDPVYRRREQPPVSIWKNLDGPHLRGRP